MKKQSSLNNNTSGVSVSMATVVEPYSKLKPSYAKVKTKKSGGDKSDPKSDMSSASDVFGADEFTIAVMERDDDLRYGWGSYTPSWLQSCCTPQFLLFALMFIGLAQGFFVHGILPSSWVPIHDRFHFTMVDMGLIRIMYDVGMLIGFVPIMYFSAHGARRPMWLGISCLVMAIGAFTCMLLHFCVGKYDPSRFTGTEPYGCNGTETDNTSFPITTPAANRRDCDDFKALKPFKYVFGLGVFVNGLGASAYFTMGIAFLDESVSRRRSVLYTGALGSAMLLGGGLGFHINAAILDNLFVHPGMRPSDMDAKNPHWIGAWWLGVLLSTILFIVAAIPMFGFPNRLPGVIRAHLQDIMDEAVDKPEDMDAVAVVQNVWKSLKACLTNVTYLGLIVEQCAYMAAITTFTTFMPVYLKALFGVIGAEGRVLSGIVVLSALFGSICGTFLQHRLSLSMTNILRLSLATAVATLIFLLAFFIRCADAHIPGWTSPYPVYGSNLQGKSAKVTCNMDCTCGKDFDGNFCYRGPSPETWHNKKRTTFVYFSPCYAGCLEGNETAGQWTNCGCVPKDGRNGFFEGGGTISKDECEMDSYTAKCKIRAKATVILFCWCAILTFLRLNPLQQCLLRVIPFKDRVVGLTMSAFVSRIFGALPAPPVMGAILYGACKLNREVVCGMEGGCLWRDENEVGRMTAAAAYLTCAVSIVGLSVAYYAHVEQKKKSKKAIVPSKETCSVKR